MALSKKDAFKLMDLIDSVNPYSTYLEKSTLSKIDEYIDTGSLALNAIISGSLKKGIPVGRITQFAGPSQTGKTFFCYRIIANAQKMGKYVVIFDSENAIDPDTAKKFGIDCSLVKYCSALTVENTRNAINTFLKGVAETGNLGEFVIIVDNIASMDSELAETRMDKNSTASDMGNFAKSIKALLKTCTKWSTLTKATIVFTNEIYHDPTEQYPSLIKNMPGGEAAVYKPSVTIQLARNLKKADEGKTIDDTRIAGQVNASGVELKCRAVKNRLIPLMETSLYLSFATGLDRYYGLKDHMKDLGVITLDGARYSTWDGQSLGFYKTWRKDKKVWAKLIPELEKRIQEKWKYGEHDAPEDDDLFDEDDEDEVDLGDVPEIVDHMTHLKNLKERVSSKVEELEAEEEDETEDLEE